MRSSPVALADAGALGKPIKLLGLFAISKTRPQLIVGHTATRQMPPGGNDAGASGHPELTFPWHIKVR